MTRNAGSVLVQIYAYDNFVRGHILKSNNENAT